MNELVQMIAQAMGLVTRLRSISERSKDSELKTIVADLLLQLAEVQLKLDELLNDSGGARVAGAPAKAQVELCPRCGEAAWKPVGSKQGTVGVAGRISQTYKCGKCGLKEEVAIAQR